MSRTIRILIESLDNPEKRESSRPLGVISVWSKNAPRADLGICLGIEELSRVSLSCLRSFYQPYVPPLLPS